MSKSFISKLNDQQDVFMAARVGDAAWLKQILSTNSNYMDSYNEKGLTAFHIAALNCRLKALKIFLEDYNIFVNKPTSTGWTALHLCINNVLPKESYDCLSYLIQMGADSNSVTTTDLTPLHLASSVGHLKNMQYLVEHKACVGVTDERDQTPFTLALLWGHRKAARYLAHRVWLKTKNDESIQRLALEKYCKSLQLKHVENEELQRKESKLKAQECYQDWHRKNKFVYNPLLFGPVTNEEREGYLKHFQRLISTGPERVDNCSSVNTTKMVFNNHEEKARKEEKKLLKTKNDDRRVKFIPLSNTFKL